MFQWLINQIRPFTTRDLIEELVPGHSARRTRRSEHIGARDRQWHEQQARALKRNRLERELKDAEWILEYEKRLISLQKKTATQRSQAQQLGTNTDRLRRLEHHLAGLRRNLSLD